VAMARPTPDDAPVTRTTRGSGIDHLEVEGRRDWGSQPTKLPRTMHADEAACGAQSDPNQGREE